MAQECHNAPACAVFGCVLMMCFYAQKSIGRFSVRATRGHYDRQFRVFEYHSPTQEDAYLPLKMSYKGSHPLNYGPRLAQTPWRLSERFAGKLIPRESFQFFNRALL